MKYVKKKNKRIHNTNFLKIYIEIYFFSLHLN